MLEIRFHGRGGQGAVVASRVLAQAFFLEGQYVQSFPAFGVERRGAPVAAFIRVDGRPILLRTNIYEPDHIVVLDENLMETEPVTAGLRPGGSILVNSAAGPESFQRIDPEGAFRLATVDASAIAARHKLGSAANPIVNTAILGATARLLGGVRLESVSRAIAESVPFGREANVAAAVEAYESVRA